jgi:hypothetical protein
MPKPALGAKQHANTRNDERTNLDKDSNCSTPGTRHSRAAEAASPTDRAPSARAQTGRGGFRRDSRGALGSPEWPRPGTRGGASSLYRPARLDSP